MAEVVESGADGQSSALQKLLEGTYDVAVREGCTNLRGRRGRDLARVRPFASSPPAGAYDVPSEQRRYRR